MAQQQNKQQPKKKIKDKQIEALKVPPHSLEAEQSVLGGLMLDNEAWDRVAERVSADDFYRREHRQIFNSMHVLVEGGQPIDLVTLSEALERENQLDEIGGFAYIGEMAKNTPSAANISAYAEIVRERAVVRDMISVANEIAEAGFDPQGRDSAMLLDYAESKVFKIAEQRTSSSEGPQDIKQILGRTVDQIEELFNNPHDGVTGVSSGYQDLDKMTAGFQPSDLIIVAARPSMGKCIVAGSRLVDPCTGAMVLIDDLVKEQQGQLLTLTNEFKLTTTSPSAYVDDGIKPVFKVTTALGRQITTTITHPFLTGKGWLPLSELTVGSRIGVPRQIPVFGNESLPEHQVKALAYFIGDGGTTQTNPMFTNANEALRDDFCQSIEAFGAVSCQEVEDPQRTPSIRVSSDEQQLKSARAEFGRRLTALMVQAELTGEQLADKLAIAKSTVSYWTQGKNAPELAHFEALCELFIVTPADFGLDDHAQMASNAQNRVTQWLQALGLWDVKAIDKVLPEAVYRLPKDQLALFLSHLFACDGSAFVQGNSQCRISYASSSESLAQGIQHLLLRFGIVAKLRAKSNHHDSKGPIPYEVEIMGQQSLRLFVDEIGIFSKETALSEVAAILADKAVHTNNDTLPESVNEYILAIKGSNSWSEIFAAAGQDCPEGFNPHMQGTSRRGISRDRVAFWAELFNDDYLYQLANSDLFWDKIVAIEPMGEQQVYDLTVDDTHNFIAEDICVHNTTFAMNLAEYAAMNEDKPVIIYSLEMPSEQIMMRMLASLGRVDQTRIRTGQLEDDDWARVSSTMGLLLEQGKMYVDDSSGLTPTEVRSRARRIAREHDGVSMIMIDYLQLMQVPALSDNRTLEIAEISRSLKSLAKELKCPVIALSQLNRSLEQRADKRPVNSDLRESGSIEQDADLIMFIYRDEVYNDDSPDKGTAEIIIGKQRNGPIGKVRLTFQGQFSRFDSYAGPAFDDEY